ncbi:MAG: putative ABC transporter permease [Lachnospiraceae bacterium]|nr:putative ABC transporter permease [Lachnospiraceae bacterium]
MSVESFFAGLDFPGWTIAAVIYAFIGWFYESTIFSLCEQGKFMDRGAFLSPVCPIYAMVCTFSYDLFHPIEEWWLLVILAGTITSLVELLTSIGMEAIFHKRYWDYSYFPLNFDGRISVVAGAFFGFALMAMVKWIHPAMMGFVGGFSFTQRLAACLVIWAFFGTDLIWTFLSGFFPKSGLARAHKGVEDFKQRRFDKLNEKKTVMEKWLPVRGFIWGLNKGKAMNRKIVAVENRLKGKKEKPEEQTAPAEAGEEVQSPEK